MARAARSGTRADFVLFALAGAGSLLALILPMQVREATASGLRRSVVAPLVAIQRRAELSRTAILTHDSATASRDSVAMQLMTARALEAENTRLRRLLGLAQKLRWGFVPAEALKGASSREDFAITLTAGANAGVQRFSPVVAPEGLVGMVQTVDPTMSLAISWSHPDFRVSAMTADGSTFGIVAAHLGEGTERYMLELRGIPFRTTLKPGTLVLSSGLGGTYPRGIPIGTVQGEMGNAEGWARTYLVRPAVLPPDITSVLVLTTPRVAAGVQNVWASQAALDSAVRAVVAAGDSVARLDSATARAARAAAADSAARAAQQRAAAQAGAGTPAEAATAAAPPVRRDSVAPRPRPRPVPPRDTTRRDTTRRAPAATATPTATATPPVVPPVVPPVTPPDTAKPGEPR